MNKFLVVGGMALAGYIGHKIGYFKAIADTFAAVREVSEERLSKDRPNTIVMVDTRHNAEELYCKLQDNVEKYGFITVKDLYEIAGFDSNLNLDNDLDTWGWCDISATRILQVRDGYTLRLPKPVVVN
jgi:transketolase N-terminal domain/subunit